MERSFLSRPMQLAFDDGLIDLETSVFDYGCGRGGDVDRLRKIGIKANGWDPAHSPDSERMEADVVNLGFVINVIEDHNERIAALQAAWSLARSGMVVAARPTWEAREVNGKPHGDGLITSKGTFQKFYDQEELRSLLDAVLETKTVAAGPGIFYAFKTERSRQRVLATLSRDRPTQPTRTLAELILEQHRELLEPVASWVETNLKLPSATDLPNGDDIVEEFGSIRSAFAVVRRATDAIKWAGVDLGTRKTSERRFEQNLDVLQPLIDFLTERGRLPHPGELANEEAVNENLGSIRRAYSLIRKVTGTARWSEFEQEARDEFTTYLAVTTLSGRPRFSDLPEDLQHDVKDFFGSHKAACEVADQLLFGAGNLEAIGAASESAKLGKLTPEAFYVHVSALHSLPPLLRVYEGCARSLSGRVNNATIIKMHRLKPQVSYLIYPKFDRDPHPALQASVIVRLGRLDVNYRSFIDSDNPPILHRKELFVAEDYPGYAKFKKLTTREERAGLLSRPGIGTKLDWQKTLESAGYLLRGHRLTGDQPNRR